MNTRVLANANAFLAALGALQPDLRAATASSKYAREFNTLLLLVREVVPGIDPRLLPEPIGVRRSENNTEIIEATYVEIQTYVLQLIEQLKFPQTSSTTSQSPDSDKLKKAYSVPSIRKAHAQAYLKWTKEDDNRLARRYGEDHVSIADLAKEFGRQTGGIHSRLRKLGLLK